ncbi:MAG: DUF1059 domain-containing protein [Methylotenera sp.]|nr:DUF1059 domain-containing protein [Oligoflexia bacterium]
MDDVVDLTRTFAKTPRVMADCRQFPSEKNCTLTLSGKVDEVLAAATAHAVSAHGHTDSPELREQLRQILKPESDLLPDLDQSIRKLA